jgi:two-component system, HptB-dependent secretion and biofilm response regulator
MRPALSILVVDDSEPNRLLLTRFIEGLGHEVRIACDGQEAVEACKAQLPDVILMDIVMPNLNGYSAAVTIRQNCAPHWLPIIFLSAKTAEVDQLEVLQVGDDFLPKPVNLRMLGAKINVMTRLADMQRRLADNALKLEAYRIESEREQHFARQMLDEMMGYHQLMPERLQRWIKPATQLSGDLISHVDDGHDALYVMLADSTGHGLSAAICCVPAFEAFSAMANDSMDLPAIATEVQKKLKRLLPTGHFLSAVLLKFDFARRSVEIWHGGIPFVGFIGESRKLKLWPSQHPPLGALPDKFFDASTQSWQWDEPGHFIVCSDGILEAESEQGAYFGEEGMLAALLVAPLGGEFEAVKEAVSRHLEPGEPRDDMSLAVVRCA